MEYLRIFIPFQPEAVDMEEEQDSDDMFISNVISVEDEDTEAADNQIRAALNKGFKIVSTTPITGTYVTEEVRTVEGEEESDESFEQNNPKNIIPLVKTYTYTDGIEVFLVKE